MTTNGTRRHSMEGQPMATTRLKGHVNGVLARFEALAGELSDLSLTKPEKRSAQVVRSAVRFADSLFRRMGKVHWSWSTELAFERELSKAISDHLTPRMGQYEANELALAWLVEREKAWQSHVASRGSEGGKELAEALTAFSANKDAYDWVSTFCS